MFRTIRKITVLALALMLLVGAAVYAQGQGQGARGGVGGRGGAGGPGGPGGLGINLQGLDLTETQRQQIREITQRYQEQMRTEILNVLTPEQQEKAKQLQQSRRDQRRDQRQQQR